MGKVAHDIGLLTWFGGTFFGQVSLNPTVSSISDESERGRVLKEAWARFQAANLPAMLSTLVAIVDRGQVLVGEGIRYDTCVRRGVITDALTKCYGSTNSRNTIKAVFNALERGARRLERLGPVRLELPRLLPVVERAVDGDTGPA